MDVHQVLVAAASGDAITNEALALQRTLRGQGASEVFALHRDPEVPGVRTLSAFDELPPGPRLVVYHSSIGEPVVTDFLATMDCPMVVRYHNITPAEFFEPYDPAFARLLERGRRDLEALRQVSVRAIAVSEFNAAELRAMGFTDVVVSPLLVDLDALLSEPPSQTAAQGLPAPDEGPMLLFVGRLAPNKNQQLLMQAFHILKTYMHHDAHMFLVGGRGAPAYEAALQVYYRELALQRLSMTDMVSAEKLAAMYRRADVFLCLSAHEGFCAPVVEAMSFGVPVVAWGVGALPETAGGAALLIDEPGPALAAEAVSLVLGDAALREGMVARGKARATALSLSSTAPALAAAILGAPV